MKKLSWDKLMVYIAKQEYKKLKKEKKQEIKEEKKRLRKERKEGKINAL